MNTITVGSQVEIIGVEDGKGKVIQFDPEGVAIVELKTRMAVCLPIDLILIK